MHKYYILIPATYLAFTWQAALRPEVAWNGYAPNFLVIVLIAALWLLSDASALVAAAVLGLLSDSLAARHLGNDMLCYLTVAVVLQIVCPPKLLRHSTLVVAVLLFTTIAIEFSATGLRATLGQESLGGELAADGQLATAWIRWALLAIGNGFYTGLLAVVPLMGLSWWNSRVSQDDSRVVGNRWHRLTS